MIVRKTETEIKKQVGEKYNKHTERYLITTWWFLFIPVYKYYKLNGTSL